MEPILNVEREVDFVIKNFKDFNSNSNEKLTALISSVESLRDTFENLFPECTSLTNSQVNSLNSIISKVREVLDTLSVNHKKIHVSVSKLGKSIDKNFYKEKETSNEQNFFINLSEANKFTLKHQEEDEKMDEDLESNKTKKNEKKKKISPFKQLDLINKAILQHFFRIGQSEIANVLINEASIDVEDTLKWPFNELSVIIEAIKKWNLDPALEWALKHKEELNKKNSILIFKLYKLKFIEMLKKIDSEVTKNSNYGDNKEESMICNDELEERDLELQKDLISFARTNFQPFFNRCGKEIQQLMCCLLYLPSGIRNSPYKHLFEIQESDVVDLFTREACSLLGLSLENPLIITFNAGCKALPALINIWQVMEARQVTGVWNCRDELPIGIDLGKEKQYHSVFSCPILKEQSKDSNPPMRLTCGHVISKDALTKLTNGTKLKCPYCPIEQNSSDAIQIVF